MTDTSSSMVVRGNDSSSSSSFGPPSNSVQVSPRRVQQKVVADEMPGVAQDIRQLFYNVNAALRKRQANPALPPVRIAYLVESENGKGCEGGVFKVADIATQRGRYGTMTLKLHRESEGKIYESELDLRKDGPRILCINTVVGR